MPRPSSHIRRDRKHSIWRQFGITVVEYESYVERFKEEQVARALASYLEVDNCRAG